ncbi:hypothetical protein [Microtetraspora malaysiensis]|uniref:hypothetical protein n=1 Tax=Microtetraspora malaysiensis TaxID=161358 RepID=UPI003D9384EB
MSRPAQPAGHVETKAVTKPKNVNPPKATGKVFFNGFKANPLWRTTALVQSAYKNLAATAGHCVFDTESNAQTLNNWLFIPDYHQGRTPGAAASAGLHPPQPLRARGRRLRLRVRHRLQRSHVNSDGISEPDEALGET